MEELEIILEEENYYELEIILEEEIISGSIAEDLTTELANQNALITEQEITIEEIVEVLQGKTAGGEKIILEVENKTLIISKAKVEGGVLSL
jgi:hypothetical protein